MELKNTLYNILLSPASSDGEGGAGTYRIELLQDSIIYRAHFPGRPITPGACMIQMVQELAQDYFSDSSLQVKHINNVKFLALLEPQYHQTLDVVLKGTPDKLMAELRDGDLVFAKLSVVLAL